MFPPKEKEPASSVSLLCPQEKSSDFPPLRTPASCKQGFPFPVGRKKVSAVSRSPLPPFRTPPLFLPTWVHCPAQTKKRRGGRVIISLKPPLKLSHQVHRFLGVTLEVLEPSEKEEAQGDQAFAHHCLSRATAMKEENRPQQEERQAHRKTCLRMEVLDQEVQKQQKEGHLVQELLLRSLHSSPLMIQGKGWERCLAVQGNSKVPLQLE